MFASTDFFILFMYLIEVIVLLRLEKYLWDTYLTPITFLMIPYTLIVLISLSLPASLGFIPLYIPSILLWNVGLLVFFIPSLVFGLKNKLREPVKIVYDPPVSFLPVMAFGGILILASLFFLFTQSQVSDDLIGSEDFADATIRNGIWGHVREALLAILIFMIFFFRKEKVMSYLFLIGILMITFVYQVKSWILIPLLTGFVMRLQTGIMKINFKYLLYTFLGSASIFFLSYYLILVWGTEDGEFDVFILELIYKHFIHYLISGVNGFSMDLQQGILETPNPASIFAPFLNMISMFTGGEMISPINPIYLDSGWTFTNVRTFFGTIYINLGAVGAAFYALGLSSLVYGILYKLKNTPVFVLQAIYAWICALLFMGWFEFYFFHLTIIEVPLFIYFYYYITFKFKWKTLS